MHVYVDTNECSEHDQSAFCLRSVFLLDISLFKYIWYRYFDNEFHFILDTDSENSSNLQRVSL